jgi:hypothetical protein
MFAFLVAILGVSSAFGFSFAQNRVTVNQRGEATQLSMVSPLQPKQLASII